MIWDPHLSSAIVETMKWETGNVEGVALFRTWAKLNSTMARRCDRWNYCKQLRTVLSCSADQIADYPLNTDALINVDMPFSQDHFSTIAKNSATFCSVVDNWLASQMRRLEVASSQEKWDFEEKFAKHCTGTAHLQCSWTSHRHSLLFIDHTHASSSLDFKLIRSEIEFNLNFKKLDCRILRY